MIIEKAVDKAKKIGSSVEFFLKTNDTNEDSQEKVHSDKPAFAVSRLVELNNEYI